MDWYEAEVRQLERKVAAAAGNPYPSVFYGSSTIRMWERLAQDLVEPGALNLGFGGSTLEACVYFFDRLVGPLQPRSLVVYAGENDLGDGQKPQQVLASFRALSAKVKARFPGIPFGFISIKPSPARLAITDRIRFTNAMIETEVAKYPHGFYVSVFDAMLNAGGKPRPELFLDDGLHMGPRGYRLWTQLLEPYRNQISPAVPLPGGPWGSDGKKAELTAL